MSPPGLAFDGAYAELLKKLPDEVADARAIHLPGRVPPWTDSGLELRAGDSLSLLASGGVGVPALGLHTRPSMALWARIGERGTIWNGARDTQTREVPAQGSLWLGIYSGEWANRQGDLATPTEAYAGLEGGVDVLALAWRGDARAGLESLHARLPDDPRIVAELERLETAVPPPEGWEYLWFLGESETFRRVGDTIVVHTDDTAAILRRPLDLPLTPDTELCWRWRVLELPSARAEDQLFQHDYLSIALEFDDGRDLTWYWSATLPEETCFACPIPVWSTRETHLVARSGSAELGVWHDERRRPLEDYRRAVGDPPGRIVACWLIAVSLFQHGRGRAEFADIAIETPQGRFRVD